MTFTDLRTKWRLLSICRVRAFPMLSSSSNLAWVRITFSSPRNWTGETFTSSGTRPRSWDAKEDLILYKSIKYEDCEWVGPVVVCVGFWCVRLLEKITIEMKDDLIWSSTTIACVRESLQWSLFFTCLCIRIWYSTIVRATVPYQQAVQGVFKDHLKVTAAAHGTIELPMPSASFRGNPPTTAYVRVKCELLLLMLITAVCLLEAKIITYVSTTILLGLLL